MAAGPAVGMYWTHTQQWLITLTNVFLGKSIHMTYNLLGQMNVMIFHLLRRTIHFDPSVRAPSTMAHLHRRNPPLGRTSRGENERNWLSFVFDDMTNAVEYPSSKAECAFCWIWGSFGESSELCKLMVWYYWVQSMVLPLKHNTKTEENELPCKRC